MNRTELKPRVCNSRKGGCGETFQPARPMQKACSPTCARGFAEHVAAKKAAFERRDDKARTRVALEALKTVPVLKKEAQAAFNRYVRLRDNGRPCFVCGAQLCVGGIGGGFDAGHIRSRGEADHLRYDERNVFGQCKRCNAAGSTKPHVMREAATRLLGVEVAEALYADNAPIKWTRDGLRAIRDKYRALANSANAKPRRETEPA